MRRCVNPGIATIVPGARQESFLFVPSSSGINGRLPSPARAQPSAIGPADLVNGFPVRKAHPGRDRKIAACLVRRAVHGNRHSLSGVAGSLYFQLLSSVHSGTSLRWTSLLQDAGVGISKLLDGRVCGWRVVRRSRSTAVLIRSPCAEFLTCRSVTLGIVGVGAGRTACSAERRPVRQRRASYAGGTSSTRAASDDEPSELPPELCARDTRWRPAGWSPRSLNDSFLSLLPAPSKFRNVWTFLATKRAQARNFYRRRANQAPSRNATKSDRKGALVVTSRNWFTQCTAESAEGKCCA